MTSLLDRLIPAPRLLEVNHVDLGARPEQVWSVVRHGELARSKLTRALFALRALPERLTGKQAPSWPSISIDTLRSTPDEPGFSLLLEDEPRELAVGAIGRVWKPIIDFVHVPDAASFLDLSDPGLIKVAWSLRTLPLGEQGCRLEIEVRVDATDEAAWAKFQRYFRLIGPGSHLIRRLLLAELAAQLGTLEAAEKRRALPGDELLPVADAELTDGISLAATPEEVWPWLVQIGCHRAGFYGVDWLDNGGERSSREIIPELQELSVGRVVPATPQGQEGFEVLAIEAPHRLILGNLYDVAAEKQVAFSAPRPQRYWQVTWSFVLEPLSEHATRLHVRARASFSEGEELHASWLARAHHFMQPRMLQHLAARVEGRLPRNDWRDVCAGVGGAALMLAAFVTPFLRSSRSHWGVSAAEAALGRPGDELVAAPLWSWTHAVNVQATPELVWHWVAQIGADRGGFYSYQWLENLVGCGLRNTDAIHQEWELELGDELLLHPAIPPLGIVELELGRHFVAFAPADERARAAGKPWAMTSWLFQLEPLPDGNCRVVTRYRVDCSSDVRTRIEMGPTLLEPIGFAMDRRMLLGIKQSAERQAHYALTTSRSRASRPSTP